MHQSPPPSSSACMHDETGSWRQEGEFEQGEPQRVTKHCHHLHLRRLLIFCTWASRSAPCARTMSMNVELAASYWVSIASFGASSRPSCWNAGGGGRRSLDLLRRRRQASCLGVLGTHLMCRRKGCSHQ